MNTALHTPTPADLPAFLPMVRRLAVRLRRRLPSNVELDDLMQAGSIGLMDALQRFDPASGCSFEAFAAHRVRGAMQDELRGADWLSRSQRDAVTKLETARRRLTHRTGRSPRAGELAAELGQPLAALRPLLDLADTAAPASLDEPGPLGLLRQPSAGSDADPLQRLAAERLRQAIADAVRRLPERQQLLLALLYDDELPQAQIADVLDVTPSRVCQLHRTAMTAISASLAARDLLPAHLTPGA